MNEKDLNLFLEDISYNAQFKVLDEGKDQGEIENVAKKARIVWPSPDLAMFKCIYAFISDNDKEITNANGCRLPREEVEKSLPTLIGKSVDIDHFRKRVIGHWVDAKIEGNKIIAYGAVYKSSFGEDYEIIKELFDNGNLSVSFESWGKREYREDGTYDLVDQTYAGGALLFKEKPAFKDADVLEVAKKERILEFAKVMTPPQKFVHIEEDTEMEKAKYYISDFNEIQRCLSEMDCPSCGEKGCHEVLMMDYEMNKARTGCYMCGGQSMVNLTPQPKMTKKGRKIKQITDMAYKGQIEDVEKYINEFDGPDIALENLIEQSIERPVKLTQEQRSELTDEDFAIVSNIGNKKIRILPIHDLDHIIDVSARLDKPQVEDLMIKLGAKKDKVKRKMSRRYVHWAMKELLEKYKKGTAQEVIQEIAKVTIGRELTPEELEKAYNIVDLMSQKKVSVENNHALNNIPKKESTANETSIQNASVTEEEIKASITEATRKEVQVDPKETEIAQLKAELAEAQKKIKESVDSFASINKELADLKKEKSDREAAEKAALVTSRKTELADFAKDMSDEDILDEIKYELAKLKKENAELKKGSVTTTSAPKVDLVVGSQDKTENLVSSAKKIDAIFNQSIKEEQE